MTLTITIDDDLAAAIDYLSEVDGVPARDILREAMTREIARREVRHQAILRNRLSALVSKGDPDPVT